MMTDAVEEIDWTAGIGAILLQEQSECQHAGVVAAAIYEDAERIKRDEVEGALDKLDARGGLSDVQREVVEGIADAIVDQLLAGPTRSISNAVDRSTPDTAARVFDLEVEANGHEMHEAGSYRTEVTSDDD